MIVLKSLTLSNIGRFVEEQVIDFTQLGSLVQIDGQNLNTGGSSGAGKSTIFKALDFLLGLSDLSNTVLQSRLTKESMSVTGIFELDGQPLKIQRGKKLLIDFNGEVTIGSSKLTEEKLDQIIGMPRDLFRKILHKRQGVGGFFLDMGPSDVHKFLTNCLGLQLEQDKILKLDEILKALLESETLIKGTIESNRMGLEASQSAITSLGPIPILDIAPEAIEELKSQHLDALNNHKLIAMNQKLEVEELEKSRPQISTNPFDRSSIELLENEIGIILAQISSLEKLELDRQAKVKSEMTKLQIVMNDLGNSELIRQSNAKNLFNAKKFEISNVEQTKKLGDGAKEEAVALAKKLQKIRASICPTCEQGWATDATKVKEANLLGKIQECKKIVITAIEADKKLAILEEEGRRLLLETDSQPISGFDAMKAQLVQFHKNYLPEAIPEATELKMKVDFNNKELLALRQEEKNHQFKENAIVQAILADFAQKQTGLRKSHETHIEFVRENETRTLAKLEAAKNKVRSFEEAKKRFDTTLKHLEESAFIYQDQISQKSLDLSRTQQEIELATEAKKAIKSYLSASFEDALDSIGDQATKLIRAIPNMSTATIQFEGLKETKEGKIKEEVNCLISMDGEIGIPVKSLSGGERSSTDLAIDLAVIKFIEEHTGKGIDLMILDEPFTGLDTTNVFEALEMLKECSVDKRLLIVDHNQIATQSIESRLTVVREGLTSKIIQQ